MTTPAPAPAPARALHRRAAPGRRRSRLRHAALYLALASGYQPLNTADPVIDRALDELPGYPPERQARLLTYAARRAGTT